MRTRLRRERAGVSEVIGAMMLIIVVVVAVASLGLFVSYAQKQAFNSQNYLTNVQNDNLQVVYAQFYPSSPLIQWELDSISSSTPCMIDGFGSNSWYVQQNLTNPTTVKLIPQQASSPPVTVTLNPAPPYAYNSISAGEQVMLGGTMVTFDSGTNNCVFQPATWGSITLTIRNTNTQTSSLAGIEVNTAGTEYAASSWSEVNQTGSVIPIPLGANQGALAIPAGASVNIQVVPTSFGPSGIKFPKDASLSVALLSSVGNRFSTQYSAPSAIAGSSSFAEEYRDTTRDVVTLNGSNSYSTGSSISTYEWAIDVLHPVSGACPSSFPTSPPVNSFDTVYLDGQSVQYSPDLFSPTDCLTGPIRATLTVTDRNGLMSASPPLVLAPDPDIDPVGGISAATTPPCTSPCTVTVTVTDSFGNPMAGQVVNAIAEYGDVTTTQLSQTTGSGGTATFTVSFTNGGSMDFETGALQPAQLAFQP
jgi:Bacterial Ig-like domain (group 1)